MRYSDDYYAWKQAVLANNPSNRDFYHERWMKRFTKFSKKWNGPELKG